MYSFAGKALSSGKPRSSSSLCVTHYCASWEFSLAKTKTSMRTTVKNYIYLLEEGKNIHAARAAILALDELSTFVDLTLQNNRGSARFLLHLKWCSSRCSLNLSWLQFPFVVLREFKKRQQLQRQRHKSMIGLVEWWKIIVLHVRHAFWCNFLT